MSEQINNVAHYKGTAVMEFIELFDLGFKLANTVKYITRAGRKHTGDAGILVDLQKAKWYLDREIKLREIALDQNTHHPGDRSRTPKRKKSSRKH